MENTTKKIAIAVAVLSGILFINFAILAWIYPKLNQGKINTTPFSPPINTVTSSPQPNGPTPTNGPTPSPLPLRDLSSMCVYPAVYWANNPENWPVQIKIGTTTTSKADALAAFKTPIKDVSGYLFIQITTAYLNNARITPPASILQTTAAAAAWLNAHPAGTILSDTDRQAGLSLGLTLENYNNGKINVGLCSGVATDVPFTLGNLSNLPGSKGSPATVIIPTITLPLAVNPYPTLKPTQTKNRLPPSATRAPATPTSLKPTNTLIPSTITLPPAASPTLAPPPTAAPTVTQSPLPPPPPSPTPPPPSPTPPPPPPPSPTPVPTPTP